MTNSYGLPIHQIQLIKEILKTQLESKKSYDIKVFGSRARGDYKKYSDLDLWIHCEPPLTDFELGNIRSLFEESNLPIKIDLVTSDRVLKEYLPSIQRDLVPLT